MRFHTFLRMALGLVLASSPSSLSTEYRVLQKCPIWNVQKIIMLRSLLRIWDMGNCKCIQNASKFAMQLKCILYVLL